MVKQNKKNYYLNQRRGLIKSKARFLSIFSIVFLGASIFAGLKNAPSIMRASMNGFLQEYQNADVNLISTFAFTDEDIHLIKEIHGVEDVIGGYRFDALLNCEELKALNLGVTVYSLSEHKNFNQVQIVSGRLPNNINECVVDDALYTKDALGQTIVLSNDQGEREYTIVGTINDTRFIQDLNRGTNTLGDGTNNGFIFVLEEEIMDFAVNEQLFELRGEDKLYNELYVNIEGADQYVIFSKEYDDHIEDTLASINSFMQDRLTMIRNDIVAEKEALLKEPEEAYQQGLEEYEYGKQTFEYQINEGKIQLLNARLQLIEGKQQILDAQAQMGNAVGGEVGTILDRLNDLSDKLADLENELKNLESTSPDANLPEVELPEIELPDNPEVLPDEVIEGLEQINISKEIVDGLVARVSSIRETLNQATTAVDGLLALEEAQLEIEKAELEISKQETILENTEISTNRQLEEAKAQLDEAKLQLDEARAQINAIPQGTLYSLSRHENAGLVSFQSDSDAIQNLGNVFPLMFFLVAALVSLTTMTRMVEEQRGQSGILRALGYSKFDVINQYILYSFGATFFASILGIIFGTYVFPWIIYFLYNSLMYTITTPMYFIFNFEVSLQTLFISVFVTILATIFACFKELSEMPSVLMRPKAPKLGKRILLERITWIWKRLSFNYKVTMRNIFRYKKRFFMSIIGISGCCALVITGFGIKNSVGAIVDRQFEDVWHYSLTVNYEDGVLSQDVPLYEQEINKQYGVKDSLMTFSQSISLTSSSRPSALNATVMVCSDLTTIDRFITLRTPNQHKELEITDEGVIINQKAGELLGVKEGDTIQLSMNGENYEIVVSEICESYFLHHVYMSEAYYEKVFNEKVSYSQALVIMDENTSTNEEALKDVLMTKDNVSGVSLVSSLSANFATMMQSLDMIVILLIVFAGALAFIVLYNLTNINIQERKGEIATIKVLGFYPKEVYSYVFRENTFLALIGAFVGMALGRMIHYFIIMTVEVEMTMFVRDLNFMSYIYGIVMTLVFTAIINRIMRKVLNRVDMVESLKSVE